MTNPLSMISLTLAQDASASSKSLVDYILAGRSVGFVIVGLSLVAVGLVIAQLVRVRMARLAPTYVQSNLDALLARRDVKTALAFCQDPENDSFMTRVFGSALARCARSPFGFLELKSALEEAGQQETNRLYRATDGIGLIASIAPMLGLLGTVVGMVGAFETIGLTAGVTRPDQLAGNISQALITTVMGLIVAIPTTAAFTYLRNRIDSFVAQIAETIEAIASHLESDSSSGPPPARAPVPQPGRGPIPQREVRPA